MTFMTSGRAMLVGAVAAAGLLSTPVQAQEKPVVYSVIHGTLSDPFWAVYRKGLEDAAAKFDVDLKSLGTEVHSVQGQADLLNSAIAATPKLLISTIPDAVALEEPLRRAISQGIPVIAVNADDTRPEGERVPYMFYIGADNYLGGRLAATTYLATRKPTSTACWIHEPGHTGLEARCRGWNEIMEAAGVKTQNVTFRANNPTQAAEALKGLLTANDDIDALLAVGPPSTSVALQVIDEMGKKEKLGLFSFDLTNEQVEAIESGALTGTIEQQQYLQGYLAVELARMYLDHGFKLGGPVLTGPAVVDKANVALVKTEVGAGNR